MPGAVPDVTGELAKSEAEPKVKFQGEVPPVENTRVGPGWWMDESGGWRPPRDWPEDYPPIPGWIPDPAGGWMPPSPEDLRRREETRWIRPAEPIEEPRQSRQALADKRDMLLVTGAILAVLVVLVGALILVNQAGAADDEPEADDGDGEVIYAAETNEVLQRRLEDAARSRPAWADETLALLRTASPPAAGVVFDEVEWNAPDDGCLSISERVLVARSAAEVTFADQFECVLDTGLWSDRYFDRELERAIDADVVRRVPPVLAHEAGGWEWDRATRDAFLVDLSHPAMFEIVATGTGHNPRREAPTSWRPAATTAWCGYAIDWIAVKHRWSLGVTDDERSALAEMLATCADPDSAGADPDTTPLEAPARPAITFRNG